jgi:hemerythrin-like metal-binding protein
MKVYEWSQKLSLKIKMIDQAHKKIYDMINELSEKLYEATSEEDLGETLNTLADYIIQHFDIEDEMLEKYEYPKFEEHRAEHNIFRTKIKALLTIYFDGRYALSIDTIHFLRDWLTTHIKTSDMAYATYINDKLTKTA